MESVRFADAAAQAVEDLGLRAVFGKAMMDYTDTPGALGDMPNAFRETTRESLARSLSLYKRWHGAANGRISYAFMPRGILTTSREMLEELRALSASTGALIHMHACETWPESKLVHQRRGLTEIKYLHSLCLANERLLLAHCLCLDEGDMDILAGCNCRRRLLPARQLEACLGHCTARAAEGAGRAAFAWFGTARPATTPWICSRKCGSRRCCKKVWSTTLR